MSYQSANPFALLGTLLLHVFPQKEEEKKKLPLFFRRARPGLQESLADQGNNLLMILLQVTEMMLPLSPPRRSSPLL